MIWLSACLILMFVPEKTLQRYEVSSAWLNAHYHQNKPSGAVAFRAGNTRYSHYRDLLFREHQAIARIAQSPVGAVLIEDRHWVAFPDQLWVFTENGRLLKKLKLGSPETAIDSIGVHYGVPVIQTDEGMWRGDPASWRWSPVALSGVSWSETVAAPAELALPTVRSSQPSPVA